jgi:predicted metal-dependent phosphoesterase TrpH
VLALTDHDEIRGAVAARAFAEAHPELGVDVIVGEEISTRNGHLIGLFLEECVPPGLPAERAIELVHAQGGLAIVAHPFHPMNVRERGARALSTLVPDLPLDAIEVVNNAGFFSALYDGHAALRNVEWGLPVTAGSDAHDIWYLGSAMTRFNGRGARDLRATLVAGRTRPVVRWRWTADKAPRHMLLQLQSLLRFLVRCRSTARRGSPARVARVAAMEVLQGRGGALAGPG